MLLRQSSGSWEVVYEDEQHLFTPRQDSLSGTLHSVWTDAPHRLYVLTRHNLYLCPPETRGEGIAQWEGENWASRWIRGTAANNLFVVGFQGRIWHFNGQSWYLYPQLINVRDDLFGIAVREDHVVAVGWRVYNGIEIFGIIYHGRKL
ncbi:MAG: hypothetical protein D6681_00135 [Calditrichaeota bacterium]|nr:MAG: hypothetical protein D6681_00135 [Calditrichota bacterium]